jgi:hypothetical protein
VPRWMQGYGSCSDSLVWDLLDDRSFLDITNGYGERILGKVHIHNFGTNFDRMACGFSRIEQDKIIWDVAFTMRYKKGKWAFEVRPIGDAIYETFPMPKSKWFSDSDAAKCVHWVLVQGSNAPTVSIFDTAELVGWPKAGVTDPNYIGKENSFLESVSNAQNAPCFILFGLILTYLAWSTPYVNKFILWSLTTFIGGFSLGFGISLALYYMRNHLTGRKTS